MLDPQHAPGPETSGTAFFTYGLLWGVNNDLLIEKLMNRSIEAGNILLQWLCNRMGM
jgi:rhamnogalacturonyl hydrolase YesR